MKVLPSVRFASILVAAVAVALPCRAEAATTFQFINNVHGITGQPTAVVTAGGFQVSLVAGPAGAVLNETHDKGLGVDSRAVPGATDSGSAAGPSKLNLLGGAPPLAGTSETVSFSFNRPGIIRDLLFDGVKDETLEYVSLTLPTGGTRTYFDFETPLRLTQQGFTLAVLNVPGRSFLDDAEDNAAGVNIPFQPGDLFTVSYGEIPFPPGYVPLQNDAGNGARWEGLVVVPEPAALPLAAVAGVAFRALRIGRLR